MVWKNIGEKIIWSEKILGKKLYGQEKYRVKNYMVRKNIGSIPDILISGKVLPDIKGFSLLLVNEIVLRIDAAYIVNNFRYSNSW